MAYSQLYDFDKCFAADDATVPPDDEFMLAIDPYTDDGIQMPEKHIVQHSTNEASEKNAGSEISRMLQMTPGILPPVDKFPKTYTPLKPTNIPDFIPADERNKLPILLSEKYFKLRDDDDRNNGDSDSNSKSSCEVMNDLDGGSSTKKKIIARNSRTFGTGRAKGIDSSGSNRSHSTFEILEKYFYTVFCDDSSDEDNCNVN